MSESNDTDLALHALNNAARVRGNIKGVIHHSDHGSPYGSQTYRKRLAQLQMRASMSRTGDRWDNAVVESFLARLKPNYFARTGSRHKRMLVTPPVNTSRTCVILNGGTQPTDMSAQLFLNCDGNPANSRYSQPVYGIGVGS